MPFILFVIVIVIPAYLIAYSIFSTHQGYWCDISEFAIKSLEMPLYVKFFVCFCMWSKEDKVDSELDSDIAETSDADLSFRVWDIQSLALLASNSPKILVRQTLEFGLLASEQKL
jgi:hypothetical protein